MSLWQFDINMVFVGFLWGGGWLLFYNYFQFFYSVTVFVSDMKSLGASDILEAIFKLEEGNIDCGISSLSLSDYTKIISSQDRSNM